MCQPRLRRNVAAIGAATWPPMPPFCTTTANARSPRKPMNHASGSDLSAVSAVPVLPETGGPGKLWNAAAAVPLDTTPAISPRSESATPPGSALGVGAAGGAGSTTSWGARQVPLCTVAATMAMSSGLTATCPWPIVAAAPSAASLASGTLPVLALTPSCHEPPRPNSLAAALSRPSDSLFDSEMKAVLQEIAKSLLNGTVPATDSPWKLWKVSPPTVIWGVQGTGVLGVTPEASRPALETTLKVDPGGRRP